MEDKKVQLLENMQRRIEAAKKIYNEKHKILNNTQDNIDQLENDKTNTPEHTQEEIDKLTARRDRIKKSIDTWFEKRKEHIQKWYEDQVEKAQQEAENSNKEMEEGINKFAE